MTSLPPLSVTVATRRCSCVLDTGLALSRLGLLLAQRLGEELNLWLVRELWQILDNTEFYLANPELLMPSGHEGRLLRDIFTQWEWARIATDLAGMKLYWLGDAMYESLFPPGIDPSIVYRYESLAAALEERGAAGEADCRAEAMENSFRDAAALAAALIPHKGFMLTRLHREDGDGAAPEPAICAYLRSRLDYRPVRIEGHNPFLNDYLLPIFVRTGIAELLWAGLELAAVHLVAPKAVVMPAPEREEELFSRGLDGRSPNRNDPWTDAECFWYPVRATAP